MTPRPYSPAGADGNAGIAPVPGLPPDVGVDLLAGADAGIAPVPDAGIAPVPGANAGIAPVPDADPGIAPVPGAGPHSLLVDSGEFYAAIAPAILAARRRVYIQVMTFELDTVGARLWQLLARSPAACKILCVDAFSRIKISDRPAFGWRYWTSPSFRAEARRTRRLLRPGVRDGVRIVITNPLGAGWHKYPHRNHKKMMIVDDAAFLGGINFSDHNFAWHDLMLRTTDPTLVSALAADFQITITGRSQNAIIPTPADTRLYLLNGRHSRPAYERLFAEITSARASVIVLSPYLTNPLLSRLRALPPSVRVRIITPGAQQQAPAAPRPAVGGGRLRPGNTPLPAENVPPQSHPGGRHPPNPGQLQLRLRRQRTPAGSSPIHRRPDPNPRLPNPHPPTGP